MDVLFTSWFVAIVGIASIAHSAPVDMFYVVSPSSGSEKFYLQLNRIGPRELQPLREEFVCAAILKSPFFSTDSDLEVVYPIPKGESYAHLVLSQNGWDMFKRPYDVVNVSVLQDVRQEPVFPCLARQKRKNELSLYLISHDYDFNRWIKRDEARKECPPAGGRFVFEYNESKKMASLLAIVEEPATMLVDDRDYYVGDNFAGVSKDFYTEISKQSRKICEFSTGRKVRVCAIGLNAKEYRDEVKFLPQEDRIEPQCEERKLSRQYNSLSFPFSGWVIGCTADDLNTRETITYYVYVGYEPYELFIYHPEKRSNVSHLREHNFHSYIGEDHDNYSPVDDYFCYM